MFTSRIANAFLMSAALTVGAAAIFSGLLVSAPAIAEPSVTQQPKSWEGACVRCGEGYTWLGANRPIQNKCTRFNNGQSCNGAIVWQPVF